MAKKQGTSNKAKVVRFVKKVLLGVSIAIGTGLALYYGTKYSPDPVKTVFDNARSGFGGGIL